MSSEPRFDVVAIGEPMIELNQARGEGTQYRLGFGGDTSNAMVAASRLGARTGYVTCVGDDAFGRMLLDMWRSEGVGTEGVAIDRDAHTGVYFVTHDARGHAFSYLRAGSAASRMRTDDLPLDIIRSTRILHVSGITLAISASACDAAFAAIDVARSAGAKVAFDPNVRLKLWPLARARAIIAAAARMSDYLLPSFDDASTLSGSDGFDDVLAWCTSFGAPVVVLKSGARGAHLASGSLREHLPAHAVDCIDATGAGDCFDGAFEARIALGDTPLEAARYANVAAALATTGYGAVAPLPRHADVVARMQPASVS